MEEQSLQEMPKEPSGEFLIYRSDDGAVKLDVRLENETLWLTQQMMAELFDTTKQNISQHILSVYNEGELLADSTVKKFLTVRQEGKRQVKRELEYYNLDMIISEEIIDSLNDLESAAKQISQREESDNEL